MISLTSRYGWIGEASDFRLGSRFSIAICSAARSSSSHALRLTAPLEPPARRFRDRLQDHPRIADDPEIDVPVLADGAVVEVDLHDGGVGGEPLAVAHPEVERRTHDHDQIGVGEGVPPRQLEVVRIAGRQRAAPGPVHVGRDIERPYELDGVVRRPGRPYLTAQQDRRLLGMHKEIGEFLDGLGVTGRSGRGPVLPGLRHPGLRYRNLGVQHIARDLQEGRPGCPVVALAESHGHHVGSAGGVRHGGGELGDGSHHLDVRQVLERAHPVLTVCALTTYQQHGRLGAEGIRDPRHRVRGPRSGGDDGASRPTGDPCVTVGGMRGDLFMAHVDDFDALVDAAVVDVDDVAAAQGVDALHPLCLQRLGDQVPTGNEFLAVLGHGGAVPS